jgi:uncharacterized protein (DUF3084 family)
MKKRDRVKYPYLHPNLNLKSRQEEIEDIWNEYGKQLSDQDKAWLNKFIKEYICAQFDTKNINKNLHKSKKKIQECYKKNNDRNSCLYTKQKMLNRLTDLQSLNDKDYVINSEEELIEKLDQKLTNKRNGIDFLFELFSKKELENLFKNYPQIIEQFKNSDKDSDNN